MIDMTPLLTNVVDMMRAGRGAPRCVVCDKRIARGQESMRVRGHERAHRACATYSMRRRREGDARLGYPRARSPFTNR
jgi:hypothetical protein